MSIASELKTRIEEVTAITDVKTLVGADFDFIVQNYSNKQKTAVISNMGYTELAKYSDHESVFGKDFEVYVILDENTSYETIIDSIIDKLNAYKFSSSGTRYVSSIKSISTVRTDKAYIMYNISLEIF